MFQIRVRPITSSCMVGFENYFALMIITKRTMSLGQRSRSQSAHKVCAFQNCVHPKLNHAWWNLKIIWHQLSSQQDDVSHTRTMLLGQRSRSQLAVKVCMFQNHVRPISSSCMVGFKNYLAQMIITTRQCVMCKNRVARSKFKVTAAFTVCA